MVNGDTDSLFFVVEYKLFQASGGDIFDFINTKLGGKRGNDRKLHAIP